ncbi:hypothetical protein [Chloroflexus islandicus]|uniref:hypothetical protein n=1 Tax=Chloroflexus islandicus TaxID=1707952 RepID=UPI000AA034CB|nr:hypothetical protein [Chloroflexus islandicus]
MRSGARTLRPRSKRPLRGLLALIFGPSPYQTKSFSELLQRYVYLPNGRGDQIANAVIAASEEA